MFLFYHNIANFDFQTNPFLSKETLEKLLCVYHLFGNYHQYTIQCQLYLMNKLTLSETTVKCFQIHFHRSCSKKLLDDIMQTIPSSLQFSDEGKERNWNEYENLCENDIRLFLYLKTIVYFIEEKNSQFPMQLLSPLLILHVALLVRLSLADRHLPLNFPAVTYSPIFTQFISEFQQRLASNIVSSTSSLSWSKIADLFDGRFFTFTLYQIFSSSNLRLDSKTDEILKQSLQLLNMPASENLFQDLIKQLIETKDIVFSTSAPENQSATIKQQKTVIQISNPLINTYLEPILSAKDSVRLELIDPDEDQIIQHKNKPIWDTYKEVGDEISRIRDNDVERMKPTNHRYRTKNLQKL